MTRDKFYFINSRFDADKNAINYAIFTFFFSLFFLECKELLIYVKLLP